MFRILSIDGGGLRGYIPLLIIRDIESRSGRSIHELFNLIAGTSTGGIIACGVTYASNGIDRTYATEDLLNLYKDRGGEIFKPYKKPTTLWGKYRSSKKNRHPALGLNKVLSDKFGAGYLDKCLTPVLVPSYDIRSSTPLIFSSRLARRPPGEHRENPQIVDVLRATTAAPTYLPSHTFQGGEANDVARRMITAVDGGIFANNPALLALNEVHQDMAGEHFYGTNIKPKDIFLLSIGTGHHMYDYAKERTEEWGVIQWGDHIFDMMSRASSQAVDLVLGATLLKRKNYLRLNIDINCKDFSEMDLHSEQAYAYWEEQVNIQLLNNDSYVRDINDFLQRSGALIP